MLLLINNLHKNVRDIIVAAERQRGSTLFLTLHEVLAFSCPVLPAELCIVEISI